MSFKSLQQLLGTLEHQDTWKGRRQFQLLLACWVEVVGAAVATQTRPVSIQRRVLQVAASSAAWAQTLSFERHRILKKLNARLPLELTDIRFSTAHWSPGSAQLLHGSGSQAAQLWRDHPSRIPDPPAQLPASKTSQDPQTAFRNWARLVRLRSHQLPLCSACQSPTPAGELQRWSVCALCAAKRFAPTPEKR